MLPLSTRAAIADRIIAALGDAELKMILLTHGHFDHIGAGFRFGGKNRVRRFIFTSLMNRC